MKRYNAKVELHLTLAKLHQLILADATLCGKLSDHACCLLDVAQSMGTITVGEYTALLAEVKTWNKEITHV